jgi:hypothetical protein
MSDDDSSIAIWLPLQSIEMEALESMIRDARVLVPGNYRGDDPCVLVGYLKASAVSDYGFHALFDRNLISPLVSLASGRSVPSDELAAANSRLAAACATFCILAGILIEPNIALYEYASSRGNLSAHSDYRHFRIADNADPMAFLNIALAKADRLPQELLDYLHSEQDVAGRASPEANFERSLRLWKPNYLYVLKTMVLRRSGLSPLETAMELLRWQAEEAFYNAPASIYCLAGISHTPPKGQMLKGIQSTHARKISSGARNATWDICLLQQFGRAVRSSDSPKWSLWSTDVALREIARCLFVSEEYREEVGLRTFYSRFWGATDGEQLLNTYYQLNVAARVGTSEREVVVKAAFASMDATICALEDQLGISS